jgi:hypothetical protein
VPRHGQPHLLSPTDRGAERRIPKSHFGHGHARIRHDAVLRFCCGGALGNHNTLSPARHIDPLEERKTTRFARGPTPRTTSAKEWNRTSRTVHDPASTKWETGTVHWHSECRIFDEGCFGRRGPNPISWRTWFALSDLCIPAANLEAENLLIKTDYLSLPNGGGLL